MVLKRSRMIRVNTLLALLLALALAASDSAVARHEGAACGVPLPEDPFGYQEFIDIGQRFLVRNVRIDRKSVV